MDDDRVPWPGSTLPQTAGTAGISRLLGRWSVLTAQRETEDFFAFVWIRFQPFTIILAYNYKIAWYTCNFVQFSSSKIKKPSSGITLLYDGTQVVELEQYCVLIKTFDRHCFRVFRDSSCQFVFHATSRVCRDPVITTIPHNLYLQ